MAMCTNTGRDEESFQTNNASERNLLESGMVKPKIAFYSRPDILYILSLGLLSGTGTSVYAGFVCVCRHEESILVCDRRNFVPTQ